VASGLPKVGAPVRIEIAPTKDPRITGAPDERTIKRRDATRLDALVLPTRDHFLGALG
jgi:hypothetical protein